MVNYKEPQVDPASSKKPPQNLVGAGRKEWIRLIGWLCEHGYVSDGDTSSFEDYCRALTRLRELEQMEAAAKVEESPTNWLKMLPAITRAQDQVNRLRVQCGLTPASRASVRVTKHAKKGTPPKGADYLTKLQAVS